MTGRMLLIAVLGALTAGAQTTPYPPGQYPPGQYPPGQYPPGQYPPGQYPPGSRGPGGINLPPIPWPKRKPKEDRTDGSVAKRDTRSFDGVLRELAAKHLLLERDRTVFRFRLLPRTVFQDKDGEPVRDSLLHPGDRLSVHADKEDPETAVRVTLVKSGSASDRAAASKPVPKDSIRVPGAEDLPAEETPAAAPDASPAPSPRARTGPPPAARDESAPRRSAGEGTSLPPDQQALADAREAAAGFGRDLPNFLVQQVTTRTRTETDPPDWRVIDVVLADVASVNGKEQYTNIRVNGRPVNSPPEHTGSWSTGEFFTTLDTLFDPQTETDFRRDGEGRAAGRPAFVYTFAIAAQKSDWTLVSPNGARHKTAQRGEVWIDKESRRVLRIRQRAVDIPSGFGISSAETNIEYGFVKIEGGTYLLPVSSEVSGCAQGTTQCTRNTIEFKNYRKFSADSSITY